MHNHPRINIATTAQIELADGQLLVVELETVSSLGLQLKCDRYSELLIAPNGQWTPSVMSAMFELPNEMMLEVKCMVACSRRLSENLFSIDLKIIEFLDGSHDAWTDCIGLPSKKSPTSVHQAV